MLDMELCERYFRMPPVHWQAAQLVLDGIQRDDTAQCLLDSVFEAFFRLTSPQLAAERCFFLSQYMKHFAEQQEGIVYAAVFGQALPELAERLKQECRNHRILEDTLADYGIWARRYERETGRVGIGEYKWMCVLFCQKIYRIGRLQYEKILYREPYYLFRSRTDGDYRIVPQAGMEVLRRDAAGGQAHTLRYYPVEERQARILSERAKLNMDEYELVLAPGMPVLNLHVPEGEPLLPRQVDKSLQAAASFFRERNYPSVIGVCDSWLLDPATEEYACASENILDFQRRFRKYPLEKEGSDAINRIFGRKYGKEKPENFPEKTSLQRSLKNYLLQGGTLRDTGGFLELRYCSCSS